MFVVDRCGTKFYTNDLCNNTTVFGHRKTSIQVLYERSVCVCLGLLKFLEVFRVNPDDFHFKVGPILKGYDVRSRSPLGR